MEIVLSDETRYDDYGNFFFKDKGDKEHKIGTKRENFEELCTLVVENPNRAVKLGYDTYMNKRYIVGIELLDKEITVDETKITEQQVVIPKPPQAAPKPDDMPYPKHPLTYAIDYWSAKIAMGAECGVNDVLEAAEIFKGYMKGEIKPDVTRIIAALMKSTKKEE